MSWVSKLIRPTYTLYTLSLITHPVHLFSMKSAWHSSVRGRWRTFIVMIAKIVMLITVRSLRMLTRGQSYEVESGDSVELQCQFYADSFNLFDYPVVWHKRQWHWPHQENFVHHQQLKQQQYDWLTSNSVDTDGPVEDCQVDILITQFGRKSLQK